LIGRWTNIAYLIHAPIWQSHGHVADAPQSVIAALEVTQRATDPEPPRFVAY